MPIYNLACPQCSLELRKLVTGLDVIICPKCDVRMNRTGSGPTTRVVEIRDNGIMPKKVEQLADVKELVKKRSE